MIRLCEVNGAGTIVRCFWGGLEQLGGAVREAPEPWAIEGVNYDAEKAKFESYQGSEQQKTDLAVKDLEASKVYRTIFETLFQTINDVRALQTAAGQNKPPLTRLQLRDQMITFYKSL